jgi:3-dehydroquinate synthase
MEALYRSSAAKKLQSGAKTGHRFRSKRLRHVSVVPALRMALVRDGRLFEYLNTNAGLLRRNQPSALHYLARRCMQWQEVDTTDGDDRACSELGCMGAQALERAAPGMEEDEAAVLGILTEVAYSYLAGVLPISDLERVLSLVEGLGFPLFHPELYGVTAELRRRNRPGRNDKPVFLLRGIGQGTESQSCDPALFEHAVRLLESWGGEQEQLSWPEMVGIER